MTSNSLCHIIGFVSSSVHLPLHLIHLIVCYWIRSVIMARHCCHSASNLVVVHNELHLLQERFAAMEQNNHELNTRLAAADEAKRELNTRLATLEGELG